MNRRRVRIHGEATTKNTKNTKNCKKGGNSSRDDTLLSRGELNPKDETFR